MRVYRRKKFIYPDPDRDGLNYWRERIIFAVAVTGSGLAFLALVPALYQALTKQLWVLLIADILAFLLLSSLMFSRRFGLNAQALTVLSITFSIGVVIIWQVGFMSGGPTWLFSFSVVTGVLLGLRAALGAALLSGAVITLLAWLSIPGNRWSGNF